MIKKAVLITLSAPFLMVFSVDVFAWNVVSTPKSMARAQDFIAQHSLTPGYAFKVRPYEVQWGTSSYMIYEVSKTALDNLTSSDFENFTIYNHQYTDEQCTSSFSGSSVPISPSSANYLNNGGSTSAGGGACSVTGGGGVTACTSIDGETKCTITLEASSNDETSSIENNDIDLTDTPGGDGTFSVIDFNTPEYLEPLPGDCSDPSGCVTIGDTSYLVDWDSAPDYFSYVDANGTTHSNPSSGGGGGGGSGDNNDGGDPTDPTDPGGDTGGGDSGGGTGGGDDSGNDDPDDNSGGGGSGGGGSGGGSTVPDFEFDESGIIEAIRSSGQSNRNSIDALSNDVTGAFSDQTREINEQIDFSSFTVNDAISDQTDDVTSAIDDQTGTLTDSLDALGTTFTDALDGLGLGSIGDDTGDGDGEGDGEGEGEGSEGDGLLGGISKLLNRMVNKLADTFTEDLGSGDDLFDSSGMDETLDSVAEQEEQHSDDVNALMDEIGEGATSGIAEQITSRLPSLPSGGCVPLQFGPMEISCQAFNTIKLWLTWIIYFWTVVSIIDIFFRSEQRTA